MCGVLGTEHEKVVKQLAGGDVVLDMFAGIGPFALPAARKGCVVLANDLNPESYRWLNENIQKNRRARTQGVQTFNMDGRQFIETAAKECMVKLMREEKSENDNQKIHILMNLPASAIEFTDVFVGLLSDVDKNSLSRKVVPRVHCYCFSKADDKVADVKDRVEKAMKQPLPDDANVRLVRNVAPMKDMMCIEFSLTESVLFGSEHITTSRSCSEPLEKKQKCE